MGSDLFAFLVNEHRDGSQQHPTASWVKDLAEHPGRVFGFDDARHWSERAMSLWPNKGDPDTRPPLGVGYERVSPVMPHQPAVPVGAPGELRLDARQSDIIPEYPY